jgi:hypothetical protein
MIKVLAAAIVVCGLMACGGTPAGTGTITGPAPTGSVTPCGTGTTPGADGSAGPMGPTGAAGVDGTQGPAGAPGATGAPGPVGPQGIPGVQGPAGPVGPAGGEGAQGPVGPQGPAGPVGPQGPGLSASSVYQIYAPGPGSFFSTTSSAGEVTCGFATASCTAGDIMLGGSCIWDANTLATYGEFLGQALPSPLVQNSLGQKQPPANAYQCRVCAASNGTAQSHAVNVSAVITCVHPG